MRAGFLARPAEKHARLTEERYAARRRISGRGELVADRSARVDSRRHTAPRGAGKHSTGRGAIHDALHLLATSRFGTFWFARVLSTIGTWRSRWPSRGCSSPWRVAVSFLARCLRGRRATNGALPSDTPQGRSNVQEFVHSRVGRSSFNALRADSHAIHNLIGRVHNEPIAGRNP